MVQLNSGFATFKLSSPRRQLVVFADQAAEEVAAPLENLQAIYGPVTVSAVRRESQPGFRGFDGKTYTHPFKTRIVVEIPPSCSDVSPHQGNLERIVNAILETVQGRCVVWGSTEELYRKTDFRY